MTVSQDDCDVTLTVLEGPDKGTSHHFVTSPIRIGRSPENMLVLNDPYVSGNHGEIFRGGNGLLYADLLSTNGSCIMRSADRISLDFKTHFKVPLESGDRIHLGCRKLPVVLEFATDSEGSAPAEIQSDPAHILDAIPPEEIGPSSLSTTGYTRAFPILNRVSRDLNTVQDLCEAVESVGTATTTLFPHGTHVVILLRNEDHGYYVPAFSRTRIGTTFIPQEIHVSRTVTEHVMRKGETVLFGDAADDFDLTRSIVRARLKSGICTPLWRSKAICGMLFVENRDRIHAFDRKDMEIVTLLAHQASMCIERICLYQELQATFEQTIRGLATALEAKDHYTHGHSEKVAEYCRLIASGLGLAPEATDDILRASLMHDIGKIGVQYGVLNKEGKLSAAEFEEIKKHPVVGRRILEPIRFLRGIVPIVYHHHERYDGKGYPEGLAGEAIPLGARILAVADTYHAMTSDRAYRSRRTRAEAVAELKANAGTQFDPKVVDVFVTELSRLHPDASCEDQGS